MQPYFDKPEIDLSGKRIIAVFTAYNEADRIPYFLSYYRSMGVNHFLAIDNNSSDHTAELLRSQPDISYFLTKESYVSSKAGRLWTTELANHYCNGRWCLTLDLDEQLVFPGCERAGLGDLCDYLDEHGYEGIFTVFLDMYSAGALSEAVYRPGQPYLEICDHFEVDSYVLRQPLYFPHIAVFGGPRQRVFWEEGKRGSGPSMRKMPLIKWRQGFKYFHSTHSSRPVRLADITGVLLHFKFFSHFSTFAKRELERGDRVQTADYENYVRLTQERNLVFKTERSIRYESSSTLVQHGVAVCTRRYLNWLRPRLNQALGPAVARKYDAGLRDGMKQAWEAATLKLQQLPVIWSLLGSSNDGAIVAVHERSVLGWFLDRGGQEPIQVIEARIDDLVVARGETGITVWDQAQIDADYREALFRVVIPEAAFKDRDKVQVSFNVRDETSSFASATLYRSPQSVKTLDYSGACFLSGEGRIGGWVWMPRDAGRAVAVALHIDGQFWKRVFANAYREHLQQKGIGDGTHGFTVELPDWLDRRVPHTIHITVHGTNLPLRRSPLRIPVDQTPLLESAVAELVHRPATPKGVAGQVLAMRRGTIYGWASDEDDRSRKLRVEMLINGEVRKRVVADAALPAVAAVDDYRHGHAFAITVFPPVLAALGGRRLRHVQLRIADSSVIVAEGLSVADSGMRIEKSSYDGYCDPSEGGVLQGWAWRRDRPEEKVDVALFVDGLFLMRISASRYRDDLRQHGIGDGWYGFAVNLPQRFRDGRPHVIDAVIADTGIPLCQSGMIAVGLSIRAAGRSLANAKPRQAVTA